jgi:hypothetical protein
MLAKSNENVGFPVNHCRCNSGSLPEKGGSLASGLDRKHQNKGELNE